ncbi:MULTISPECIES: hypothetical protein [unclassified Streptomyces]|uniref:hypothetical protein n=1 Tax=unclassified Streptomyces TaxID=2593676 RepID=UPI002DD850CC|nr:hypothetical protein [Streptomyces sp. NBC_01237]WRZ73278.1 hypothetical protein OG251_17495 [Streptomyces sp. NBC_01237]
MDRFVRTGAVVAAGLLATIALTGCGGDSDSGGDSDPGKGAGSGAAQSEKPGGGSEDTGSGGTDAAALEGTWAGLTDGKAVALSIASGKVALVADQAVCQGEVKDMGEVMLALKCTDGTKDRTMGSIESNDGKTVVVSWEGGAKDTLAKTEPGKLPTGLPGMPTP